jgi:transcriptional regulator with XRE-family HTH domain
MNIFALYLATKNFMTLNQATMYDFAVLRELRKRESLTIAEVSASSGISTAVISKLERNQSMAELLTLFRLGRVFGMTAAELLALAEKRTAQEQDAETYTSAGFHFKRISYGNVQAFHGRAPAGTEHSKPEVHRDVYEICWILKGEVSVALPSEIHRLAAGQSVQFDAVLDHRYTVHEACEVLIIHLTKNKRF